MPASMTGPTRHNLELPPNGLNEGLPEAGWSEGVSVGVCFTVNSCKIPSLLWAALVPRKTL